MSSHGNGYADVEIRNAINEGRIDGPRFQVSTRASAGRGRRRPHRRIRSTSNGRPVGRRSARRRARADRNAAPIGSSCFPAGAYSFTPTGEAQYVTDVSDACPAGADRRDASARPQGRLPCLRRRGTEERDHCRLRHHRARLRPDSGAGRHDGGEEARTTIRRSSATSSRTWTTTTRRTPAASTG